MTTGEGQAGTASTRVMEERRRAWVEDTEVAKLGDDVGLLPRLARAEVIDCRTNLNGVVPSGFQVAICYRVEQQLLPKAHLLH